MAFLTPNASGEAEVLITYVLQQLAQIRTTLHGLDDEQIHLTPTASALSLAGLLRHCGQVAVMWSTLAAAAPEPAQTDQDSVADCVALRTSAAEALAYFDRCVAETEANLRSVRDFSAPVPVYDAPWFPPELKSWEVRWTVVHICTEVARHCGHADIIRETLDGKGAFELNARADGQLADDEEFRLPG